MVSFVICDSAIQEIRRMTGELAIRDPVIGLYESADVSHLFFDVRRILLDKGPNEFEIRPGAKNGFSLLSGDLKRQMQVGLCEGGSVENQNVREVCGVKVMANDALLIMLEGCQLCFESGRFVLYDSEHIEQTLLALAMRCNLSGKKEEGPSSN